MPGDFFDFDAIDRHHKKRRDEFEKLAMDPPAKSAEVGDRVLIAAGPVGRGFEWERLEAVVLEVADTAYQVRFTKRKTIYGESDEDWVHRFCVTDVLAAKEPKHD